MKFELYVDPTDRYDRSAEYRRQFKDRQTMHATARKLLSQPNRKAKFYVHERMRWNRTRRRLIQTAISPEQVQ